MYTHADVDIDTDMDKNEDTDIIIDVHTYLFIYKHIISLYTPIVVQGIECFFCVFVC